MTDVRKHRQIRRSAGLQTDLSNFKARPSGITVVVFATVVLVLGILAFFAHSRVWPSATLQISISPRILFITMIVIVLVALIESWMHSETVWLTSANGRHPASSRQEALTKTDAFTNVIAREALEELLAIEISRAERSHRSLALIMCGLDRLRELNDRYGRLAGDYVLSQLAVILKACVRGGDYVVRCGADAFLLILPETEPEGANRVRLRIQQEFADQVSPNPAIQLPMRVSLGVYVHPRGQDADRDLMEAAVQMYADKLEYQRSVMLRDANVGSGQSRGTAD